jgi:hypothetical protein
MPRYLCMLLLSAFAACTKQADLSNALPNKGFKEYIIPKGSHSALQNDRYAMHLNKLSFTVLFDSSCIYNTQNEWNAEDVNKLYGFSDCNTPHHENSARFGWRWNGKEVDIYSYCYVKSVRHIRFLAPVHIGKEIEMSISLKGATYIFEVNGKTESVQRNCSTEYTDGYRLYPYFGGDEVAPHDIRILIRDSQ